MVRDADFAKLNEALYRLGVQYCAEGKWDKALQTFGELQSRDPNYRDVSKHLRRVKIYRVFAPILRFMRVKYQREPAYYAEDEGHLVNMYLHGKRCLEAGEWALAISWFQDVQQLDPTYRDTQNLIEEARKLQASEQTQLVLAGLYNQAQECIDKSQWQPALEFLERIARIDATYRDTQHKLDEIRTRQRELQDLYVEGERALAARQWELAIELFEKITSKDGGYPGVQAKLDETRQGYRWMEMYRKGLEHVEACRWDKASQAFQSILDEGGFQEVQVAWLYIEGMKHFVNERWDEALANFRAILREVSSYQGLIESFQQSFEQLICILQEMQSFRIASSKASQATALLRADNALDDVQDLIGDGFEDTNLVGMLLSTVVRQWQSFIDEERSRVSTEILRRPLDNPYVAGNPVTGSLFVGREDVLRRLEELWSGTGQKPSVVLYGHRRMGKSSILHNLGARFGTWTVIVDFNMQRVGLVASTSELLYNLSLALYDAQQTLGVSETPRVLEEPDEERFTAHNPYTAFDRFLKRLDQVRADHRFIVTVDEFELIEQMIADGQLEPRLLDFWRGLIHTYPWFVMAFAGLHTLQEMTRDYWHPLYGSVIAIPISFLSHAASWRLITQPTPDFPLDYGADAAEHIIALTHGQPYLVQLIGHGLVTRFNRQTFEEGIERERRFSLADVEAVIGAPEFYRDGDAYFTGVWRQAETNEPPGQTAVLRALARSGAGMPVEEIARQAELAPEDVGHALETLKRHDVVMEADGRWQFTVELMRRWVAQR